MPHTPPASKTWTVQNIATLAGLALTFFTLLTLVFQIGAWQGKNDDLEPRVSDLEKSAIQVKGRVLVLETDRTYAQAQYGEIMQKLDRIEQRQLSEARGGGGER